MGSANVEELISTTQVKLHLVNEIDDFSECFFLFF